MTPINLLGSIVSHLASLRDEFIAAGVGRFVSLRRTGQAEQPWQIVANGGVGYARGPRDVWVSGDPDVSFSALRTAALMLAAALVAEAPKEIA
jgi:hypothetical protein